MTVGPAAGPPDGVAASDQTGVEGGVTGPPGHPLRPQPVGPPEPPSDTQPGPSDTQPGPSDTQPGPSDTQPGPSDTQPGPSDTQPGRLPILAFSGQLAQALEAELGDVIGEVVQAITDSLPIYRQALAADDEYDVDAVGRTTLARFLAALTAQVGGPAGSAGDGSRLDEPMEVSLDVFEELGRDEWEEGRSLYLLLSAYRVGARVLWQRISRTALRIGLPAAELVSLAETMFAFVDGLSSASARGYAEAQAGSAWERERRRLELAELLLDPAAEPAAIERAAVAAGWRPPRRLAVVLAPADPGTSAGPSSSALPLADRLGPEALPFRVPDLVGALIPDPDGPGRRAQLTDRLRGIDAVVGLPRPWASVREGLGPARRALELSRAGILPSGGPLFVEDHLSTLAVFADPLIARTIALRALEPVAHLGEGPRRRVLESLRVYLETQGERAAMAAALHLAPGSVRYRIDSLRRHFGEQLDDPERRFELLVAVRVAPLLGLPSAAS